MRKIHPRKLTLKYETVRQIGAPDLDRVRGGVADTTKVTCPSTTAAAIDTEAAMCPTTK